MEGWIKLYRKIFENPYYFSEKFCRNMAWIDLLLLANHKPGFFYKRGIKVELKAGQLGYDTASLAKRWKWSRNKCERWFRELEKDNQIVRQKTNVTTIISIVKYNIYQSKGKANGNPNEKPKGKPKGKANEHEQEYKEGIKNEKNEKKLKYADFVSLTESEYNKLIKAHNEKNTKILIEILDNYKGSTGKKYKDDYRTILNWVIDRAKKDGKYEQKPMMV
ncbi:MAG TPA: hypothetical protein PK816_09070 [Candidatus Cloacimonadota bacterium]|nr:hypothetical protein [Candidatus Cloacimonadota bacterium]